MFRLSVIGAVVAIIAIGAGLVVQLSSHSDAATGDRIGIVFALIGPAVLSLLALLKTESNSQQIAQVHHDVQATQAATEKVAAAVNGHTTGEAQTRSTDIPPTVPPAPPTGTP